MKLVSWNVNSLKARQDHVVTYLEQNRPDILMLQELKGAQIATAPFEALGYNVEAVPQKAYNGVALLSKVPLTIVKNRLPGDDNDHQARYIEARVQDFHVINIYAPNGNPVFAGETYTEKYRYKLAWMDRLYTRLKALRDKGRPFIIGGDFNVIPADQDCHDPAGWADDSLFRHETLQKFRMLVNLGLTDAFRVHNQEPAQYTFWDYQRGAWPKDHGIRIDHFLLSPLMTDRLISCTIDKEPRGWDKPSDHTPVVLEIGTP